MSGKCQGKVMECWCASPVATLLMNAKGTIVNKVHINVFVSWLCSRFYWCSFTDTHFCIQLHKPEDECYTDFWVDLNTGSKRLTLFCNQELSDSQVSVVILVNRTNIRNTDTNHEVLENKLSAVCFFLSVCLVCHDTVQQPRSIL